MAGADNQFMGRQDSGADLRRWQDGNRYQAMSTAFGFPPGGGQPPGTAARSFFQNYGGGGGGIRSSMQNYGGGGGYGYQPYNPGSYGGVPSPTFGMGGHSVIGNFPGGAGRYPSQGSPALRAPGNNPEGGDVAGRNMYDFGMWNSDERGPMKSFLENWYFPNRRDQQAAYQWGQEFGESARRYNEDTAWLQARDQFSMGLANRQQGYNEWLGQDQSRLAWDQAATQKSQFGEDLGLRTQIAQNERDIGMGNVEARNREAGIQDRYNIGQLEARNREAGIQDRYNTGTLAARNREASIQQELNRGNIGIGQESNRITEAYQSGLISNEQARQAMEERQFGQQLQQNKELANLQAWGRSKGPNQRWISTF